MADGARASVAVFPPPPPAYDQRNEAAFRSDVSRWLQEVASYPSTVAGIPTEIPAANLEFENIYPAAYKTLQDMRDVVQSAHFISGGTISAAAGATTLGYDLFTDTAGTDIGSHTPDSGWASWSQPFSGIWKIDDGTYSGTAVRGATAFNRHVWTNVDVTTAGSPFTVASLVTRNNTDGAGSWFGLIFRHNGVTVGAGEQVIMLYVTNLATTNTVKVAIWQRLNGSSGEEHVLDAAFSWTKATMKRWIVYVNGANVTVSYEDQDGSNPGSFSPVTLTTSYDDASHQKVGLYTDLSTVATNDYWYLHDFYVYNGQYEGEGTPPGINVTAGEGGLRASASDVSTLYFVEWGAATGLDAPTIGNTKYVGIEYNAGAPQAVVANTYAWDFQTKFPVGQVYNNAGSLQITQRELSRHFPKGVNVGTWLDVGTTLDVTGAGQFDSDVTIDGTLYLPTIGIVQYDQYHAITLDAGVTASWVSGDSITLDIDGDNSGTGSFFKVRTNLTTDVLTVTETGLATLAGSNPKITIDGATDANLVIDGALGSVYLDLLPYSVSGRPYLRFNNNSTMVFASGPSAYAGGVTYHFTHEYASTRTQSASIRIVGAGGGGASYLTPSLLLTHDGTDGKIESDTGDLSLKSVHSNIWYIDGTSGSLTPTAGGGLGNSSEGIGAIYTTNGTKWYVVGDNYANFGLKYSGQGVWESGAGFRIKLDADSNSSTETFVVGHDAALTALFTVSESGQVDVHTGPLTVGTPSTEDSLLNVGGKARIDNWDMTHASGYDEGLVVSGTHSVATTGGPIAGAFYMNTTHTTGAVAELYGVDIGAWNTSTGTVTWGTALEVWGGTDGGAITTLDLLYIISPWGTITTATGLRIADISAGSTNYAIYTGAGQVRFGDQVRVTDGSNNVYVNKTGAAIFECGVDGATDSTFLRAGNQSSPATNNPAYYFSIRNDNSILIYGYDGSTYRNLWEWNYATNSVQAKATTFYVGSTQVLPTVANTTNIGSSTYYLNDVYLQRVRANSYLYVYPYASGTGGGLVYLDGYAGTPTWYCRASTGTYSSKAAIGSYSSLGVWAGQGWDGVNWYTGASITLASAGSAWSATDHGTNIYFATTAEASTTLTTRWRILPAGDFIPYADNTYDLGHSSYRVQDIHAMGLYCTADYAVVNPASSAESLPTNMTNGLIVRRDGGTAPAFNSAHVAGFISASAAGTNALVSIISGNTGSASLYFGDTDSYSPGGILYNNSNNRMQFRAGGVTYMTLISNGDFCVRDPNLSELATTTTGGFLRIPSVNGIPTGTPSAFTGTLALVYDRANNDLYVYNGAWKKVALA